MKSEALKALVAILIDNHGNRLTNELITGIVNSLHNRWPREEAEGKRQDVAGDA